MALKSFESAILWVLVFITMMGLFGNTIPGQHSFNQFTTIQAPKLAPLPQSGGSDLNPFSGLIQATAYIGWAFVNLPVIIVFVTNEFVGFLNVALGFSSDPSFNSNGIPVVQFVFSFAILLILAEAFKWFRGVASGF